MRTDLPPAHQIIQTAHAAQECGQHLSPPRDEPDFMCLLSVPDETALMVMAERIRSADIQLRLIREPDLADQATALATEPITGSRRKIFRGCTLWTPASIHEGVA